MILFPFPLLEAQGRFSLIVIVGPAWISGGKPHNTGGGEGLMSGSPWRFNSQNYSHCLPAVLLIIVQVFIFGAGSGGSCCLSPCFDKL